MRGIHVVWWGDWPWRWRFYLVTKSQWGPFGELLLGPVGFTWHVEAGEPRD